MQLSACRKFVMRAICLSSIAVMMMSVVSAQYMDTLLSRYTNIREVYPLADGSVILIGEGDRITVERFHPTQGTIWITGLATDEEDDVVQCTVHEDVADSSIQVLSLRRNCDYFPEGKGHVYTLDFLGIVKDSVEVPFENVHSYFRLLSGQDSLPRVAHLEDNKVVLTYKSGDTSQLYFPGTELDTSLAYLFGQPNMLAMCVNGELCVLGTGGGIIWYRKLHGKYTGYRTAVGYGYGVSACYCIDSRFLTLVRNNSVSLLNENIPIASLYFPEAYRIESWLRDSIFLFRPESVWGADSLFEVDEYLNILQAIRIPDTEYSSYTYAVRDSLTCFSGAGNVYHDWGQLGIVNHKTLEGLQYQDVELAGFSLPSYDSTFLFQDCGAVRYFYYFPFLTVTLTNHGPETIDVATLRYDDPCFICGSAGSWMRELVNLDLMPGQTKSYTIPQVQFSKTYPFDEPLEACLTVLRPEKRLDDVSHNNTTCETISLNDLPWIEKGERSRLFPNPASDRLFLETNDPDGCAVKMISVAGDVKWEGQIKPAYPYSLDITFLPKGVYFLRFTYPDGESESEVFFKIH